MVDEDGRSVKCEGDEERSGIKTGSATRVLIKEGQTGTEGQQAITTESGGGNNERKERPVAPSPFPSVVRLEAGAGLA